MAYKTDIEIARERTKTPIQEIGAKLGIGSVMICCLMATTKQRSANRLSIAFKTDRRQADPCDRDQPDPCGRR